MNVANAAYSGARSATYLIGRRTPRPEDHRFEPELPDRVVDLIDRFGRRVHRNDGRNGDPVFVRVEQVGVHRIQRATPDDAQLIIRVAQKIASVRGVEIV